MEAAPLSGEPAHAEGSNVVSLAEYRQRHLRAPDDDPPRPSPQAARAVRFADRHGGVVILTPMTSRFAFNTRVASAGV